VEAGESDVSVAVAVEVQQPPAQHPFAAGIATGFACALLLVQTYFVHIGGTYRDMYRDFGSVALPALTRLVVSPPWLVSVPVLAASALIALVWRRPRALWPYAVVALALVATVALTWFYLDAPMRELAGNIKE
jgi:hypothetical protein